MGPWKGVVSCWLPLTHQLLPLLRLQMLLRSALGHLQHKFESQLWAHAAAESRFDHSCLIEAKKVKQWLPHCCSLPHLLSMFQSSDAWCPWLQKWLLVPPCYITHVCTKEIDVQIHKGGRDDTGPSSIRCVDRTSIYSIYYIHMYLYIFFIPLKSKRELPDPMSCNTVQEQKKEGRPRLGLAPPVIGSHLSPTKLFSHVRVEWHPRAWFDAWPHKLGACYSCTRTSTNKSGHRQSHRPAKGLRLPASTGSLPQSLQVNSCLLHCWIWSVDISSPPDACTWMV